MVIGGIAWFLFAAYVWFTKTNITYELRPDGQIEEVEKETIATSTASKKTENVITVTDLPPFSNIEQEFVDLESPKDIAILPDTGWLIIDNNKLKFVDQSKNIIIVENLPKFTVYGEGGLLGLTVDDKFKTNQTIYLVYTYRNTSGFVFNRLSSFKFNLKNLTSPLDSASSTESLPLPQVSLGEEKSLLESIPAGTTNNGGFITVGPDGLLWLLTGDAGRAVYSQNPESSAGKVLRIAKDGSIPTDNPWSGLPLYALGFRDPKGLVWFDKEMYLVDAGGTGFDEINKIVAKGNFGFPVISDCFSDDPTFINPLVCSGKNAWKAVGLGLGKTGDSSLLVGSMAGKNILQMTKTSSSTFSGVKAVAGGYTSLRRLKSEGDLLYIILGSKIVAVNLNK
jgi:glucose/arabinose dehydrogenase